MALSIFNRSNSMRDFIRYSSIENSYRERFIHKIEVEGYADGLWCIKEKIHGSNFSIFVLKNNGTLEFKPAKRSGFLKENENFHDSGSIVKKLTSKLTNLFSESGATEFIAIYGEIFGGIYPHPQVTKGVLKKVQKGVFYSPNIEFRAFDLKVDGHFIPASLADRIFERQGIPFIPTTYVGFLNECLKKDPVFQTTIPKLLGYPEIENNEAEGFVMKPFNEVTFLMDRSRVILKKKNEKFKEIQEEKKVKVQRDPLPPEVESLLHTVSTYCTLQRVENVISKIGNVSMKDFGKIMKDANLDALEDFRKDHSEDLNLLDKKHQNLISKKIGSYNAPVIKQYFRENI